MNVLYWGEWKDLLDNSNRLEILTADSVTAQEITMTGFAIEWPENEPFSDSCVFGSGATIDLLSESKLKYKDTLYTINPMQLMVKHYLNGVLNWCGWLDTEQYQDNFSNAENYNISFSANDGVSLMERLAYSKSEQTGIDTAMNVVKACLDKMGISFDRLYIGLTTTIPGYEIGSNETLLHRLNVNVANYFDETGESMSCREVINAILLPLSAKMYLWQNSVYILDVNTLASASITAKRFLYQTQAYEAEMTLSNTLSVGEMIYRRESLEMRSGVNQVNLSFNKYCYGNPTGFSIEENSVSGLVSTVEKTAVDGDIYIETAYGNCDFIEVLDATNVKFVYREKKTDDEENEWFMRFKPLITSMPQIGWTTEAQMQPSFRFSPKLFLSSSAKWVRVSFKMMLEDQSRYKEEYISDLPPYDNQTPVYVRSKIGDRVWISQTWPLMSQVDGTGAFAVSYTWRPVLGSSTDFQFGYRDAKINQWVDCSFVIPLRSDNSPGAHYSGIFWEQFNHESVAGGFLNVTFAKYSADANKYGCCIKDFKVEVCTKTPKGLLETADNGDSETIGYLDANFKTSLAVKTLHGTDTAGISRGGLLLNVTGLYADSEYATNNRLTAVADFTRGGVTGSLEDLLLNTYLSNLQKSRYVMNTSLIGYQSPFTTYQFDLLQRSGVNVRMLGSTIKQDYNNAAASLKLLEFVADELIKA